MQRISVCALNRIRYDFWESTFCLHQFIVQEGLLHAQFERYFLRGREGNDGDIAKRHLKIGMFGKNRYVTQSITHSTYMQTNIFFLWRIKDFVFV